MGSPPEMIDAPPAAAKRPTVVEAPASAGDFQKVCVVGLGVVGIPLAAMVAKTGVRTTGLDIDDQRVRAIAEGRYPFEGEEPGLANLIKDLHARDLLTATNDAESAVSGADAVLFVVQTPVDDDGTPRYRSLEAALRSVAPHLKPGALVVVESTIAPGTMREVVLPTLESVSERRVGVDLMLGHCPERVMPGKLLHNIEHYDRVVGGFDEASTARMLQLYSHWVKGELTATDMTTAEVVKTTENAYRDVQIAFANEVARICQNLGVDMWEVRELVNRVEQRDLHLPGTGVGGHCIPKDGLLLAYGAQGRFEPVMLHAARSVNESMPAVTADLVAEALGEHLGNRAASVIDGRRVAVLGVSYLPGSDDTRHTPTAGLVARLEELGADVVLADPYMSTWDGRLVHKHVDEAISGAHAVVLSTAHPAFLQPDWGRWKNEMKTPVAVDGRGVWSPTAARAAGFTYRGIGR